MIKGIRGFGRAVGAIMLIAGVCQGAVDVTIVWSPSVTDVNGGDLAAAADYKLCYSDSSGVYSEFVDAGSAAQATVSGLEYNKTYFFKAKAYTETGESVYSEELTWDTPVMLDVDTDGLSDSWELENFQSLDIAQGTTDSDDDGSSDLDEFIAGTNPDDSAEYPILEIHAGLMGTEVSFQARQAGGSGYENRLRFYTLMQCADLTPGIWTAVPGMENIPAADQTVICAAVSEEASVFYCTRIQLD